MNAPFSEFISMLRTLEKLQSSKPEKDIILGLRGIQVLLGLWRSDDTCLMTLKELSSMNAESLLVVLQGLTFSSTMKEILLSILLPCPGS
jgi:hypothetical protein